MRKPISTYVDKLIYYTIDVSASKFAYQYVHILTTHSCIKTFCRVRMSYKMIFRCWLIYFRITVSDFKVRWKSTVWLDSCT